MHQRGAIFSRRKKYLKRERDLLTTSVPALRVPIGPRCGLTFSNQLYEGGPFVVEVG
jgi:hypothetical protein